MIQGCAGCGDDDVFDVMHDGNLERSARCNHFPSQET